MSENITSYPELVLKLLNNCPKDIKEKIIKQKETYSEYQIHRSYFTDGVEQIKKVKSIDYAKLHDLIIKEMGEARLIE